MTSVQITLPDQLARDAARAGLLSPESLEALLREQLRIKSVDALFAATDRMSEIDSLPEMTPEEIAEEIRTMRDERRGTVRS